MDVKIENSWRTQIGEEFKKEYFIELVDKIKEEYHNYTVYPKGSDIFRAFDLCTFDQCKVVIIGQDPYHGPKQANGLCFSVHEDVAIPPSLVNIYKEISKDLGFDYPEHGDISAWAKEGVLLLNATLTVRAGEAASHSKLGWQKFTDAVIKKISEEKEDVVFLLWGGFAKKKAKLIDSSKHLILTSGHPSPLSANRGYWFGNKHFSKVNDFLIQKGKKPINWQIIPFVV
ncbi:MAG: uracil-DNA glycosylase [Flavobacteriales bacterium]|jgi:uracil-DNA glycosylase|nr:uracil-DNA glycosylase [Flavobacteriales bacterium]